MMTARSLLLATALLVASSVTASAQTSDDAIAAPVLRANVSVESDIVRVGDMVENAGTAAQIAIYRSPDLGTTGTLSTAQLLAVLQAHQVIGVDTRGLKSISVTRLARTIESKDIQSQIAHALEHRGGLGDATNLSLILDRDVPDVRVEVSNSGAMQVVSARFEPRSGRFDVSFEISSETGNPPVRLRYTGIAVETVETAVLTRNVERNEVLKSSDVITERRPKAEVGSDGAARNRAVGMQSRRQLHAGQALRMADLAKPDLVQRDDNVTLVYESPGVYLTMRGKALDNGTEGDTVGVLNLQSKRNIYGVVVGRDQVAIQIATPHASTVTETSSIEPAAPVSVAASSNAPVSPKAE